MSELDVKTDTDYTIEVLKQVKSLLSEFGWVRGEYGDELLGYCMVGAHQTAWNQIKERALREQIGPDDNAYKVSQRRFSQVDSALSRSHAALLRAIYGERVGSLISWNDQECDSTDEAIAIIDRRQS